MDWRELLRKAVMVAGSQKEVSRQTGYSPATISMVLSGTYTGNGEAIGQKIMEIYGGKTMQEVPSGYMMNRVGHLVPIETIKEIDIARDEFVKGIISRAKDTNEQLKSFKTAVADDMQAFFELSAEKYNADVDDSKGFLELFSFDGRYRMIREYSERLDTNERVQVARTLILDCLREWSEVAGPELKTIVEKKLQVNKKGKINIKEYLSLRSLEINHPKWKQAMEAVGDSIIVVGTSVYYRMYERDDEGKYRQIGLDFSGV